MLKVETLLSAFLIDLAESLGKVPVEPTSFNIRNSFGPTPRRTKSDFLSIFKMRSPQCAAGPAGAAGQEIYDRTRDEICWRKVSMKRRQTLKLFGAAVVAAIGISGLSFAEDQKKMVTVVKIAGIPWFNALENGVKKAGADFGIEASVVGPTHVDAAQQVKLLEDVVAQKVDVIGLVPLDVKVAEPVLKRAQAAGIPVITHEGPEQEGRNGIELSIRWRSASADEARQRKGEEGQYVVVSGR